MNYTITIVDDHEDDLSNTKNTILELSKEFNCTFSITTFHNSDFIIESEHINDLYILDIDMPNINGFQLSKEIAHIDPNVQICFCSSHENLVFQSFQLPIFYFVRKSHLKQDLYFALNKFILKYKPITFYSLNHSGIIKNISYRDIVYFEVLGNDLYIHTKTDQTYHDRLSFRKLKKELNESIFIHVNKNYIVNCAFISSIENYTIKINDSVSFPFSQKQSKKIKDIYLNYLMR